RKQESRLVIRATSPERQQAIKTRIKAIVTKGDRESAISEPFILKEPFRSNYTRDEYLARFQRVIDYINAGDCYQVNLAQCFSAPCTGDGWQAFKQLQ